MIIIYSIFIFVERQHRKIRRKKGNSNKKQKQPSSVSNCYINDTNVLSLTDSMPLLKLHYSVTIFFISLASSRGAVEGKWGNCPNRRQSQSWDWCKSDEFSKNGGRGWSKGLMCVWAQSRTAVSTVWQNFSQVQLSFFNKRLENGIFICDVMDFVKL